MPPAPGPDQVALILCFHCHQPVGNFDDVIDQACARAYVPLLEAVAARPWLRCCLHVSGVLLSWAAAHRPDLLQLIRTLAGRGQIELLTGGFYEPILPILPEPDRLGQIRRLSCFLHEQFGVEPRGLWLTERVWEPTLPRALAAAGVEYLVTDDYHFLRAGLQEEELGGYYVTEEQGTAVRVFPGSEALRYLIPFQAPEQVLRHLRDGLSRGARLAVFADDGEKFGVWPGTFEHVYRDGWLARFLDALEASRDWLTTITFSEWLAAVPPLGRVYLPTASYRELGEWALPAASAQAYVAFVEEQRALPSWATRRAFMQGGFWRSFLAKYPESNDLHKRMLRTSEKVNRAFPPGSPAHEALYRGQCNDGYWHGVFGGLYLPHLRSVLHRALIEAERTADLALRGPGPWIEAEQRDLDADGEPELLIATPLLSLALQPHRGGMLYELDDRSRAFNLLATLTRRPEAYHAKLAQAAQDESEERARTIHERVVAKEAGLERHLVYDAYRRTALLDHFLEPATTIHAFAVGAYEELGDFVTGPYEAAVEQLEEGGRNGVRVRLRRTGHVRVPNAGPGQSWALTVTKTLHARAERAGFSVRYELVGEDRVVDRPRAPGGGARLTADPSLCLFAVEVNLAMLGGQAPDRYYELPGHLLAARHLASTGETPDVEEVRVVDESLDLGVALRCAPACRLWRLSRSRRRGSSGSTRGARWSWPGPWRSAAGCGPR
ncbi:MAG: DUF1926 domain-containing protein [Deltaproteobacteria bacterium]|nr:DUF1926 domain-containing protein [Deltaproteobacteria bacterium]